MEANSAKQQTSHTNQSISSLKLSLSGMVMLFLQLAVASLVPDCLTQGVFRMTTIAQLVQDIGAILALSLG